MSTRRFGLGSSRVHLGCFGAVGAAAMLAGACSSTASPVGSTTSSVAGDPFVPCTEPAGCIAIASVGVQSTRIAYGETVGPIAYTNPPKYYAVKFTAVTGDNVSVSVTSSSGTAYTWITDSEFGILSFGSGGAAPTGGTSTAQASATIPSDGSMKHYVVFREQDLNPTSFTITLNGPPAMTYADTRIQQTDIDKGVYNADQIFGYSHFLFGNTFTLAEGLGNALEPPLAGPNPPPNARTLQEGSFGGPDATRCTQCHNVGGGDGASTLAANLFQDGDGVNLSTELVRNGPALLGDGYVQQLGIEMTADLQEQLAQAKAAAAADGGAPADGGVITAALSSKGIGFGSISVDAAGTVDFSQLDGVDSDLVVKPFGWKGRQAVLRRFVEGGFQVHFGMADQFLISENCGSDPIPNTVGNGRDCTDPDSDGVRDEILESQLTEMALYPALLQVPVQLPAATPEDQSDVNEGEKLFNQVGCASCHTPTLVLDSAIHAESPDLSGGSPFLVDLTVNGKLPRLSKQRNGSVQVPLYSDLKRHDMGESLADAHSSFNVAPSVFLTRPLWGVAVTAPYLHDGRAPDLQTAISLHDGEALAARTAFLALPAPSQAQVIDFLQTLSRDPQHTDD